MEVSRALFGWLVSSTLSLSHAAASGVQLGGRFEDLGMLKP